MGTWNGVLPGLASVISTKYTTFSHVYIQEQGNTYEILRKDSNPVTFLSFQN